ncbi:serine protease [Cesiribacter sp. SM1]|uniref:S1 family peptidase n=1 Tax=Cesiribacter sp. SM1 TaxID=2861196 RepID=UPI001CD434DE|nr:serine protease [Cesiribacter sp. SM1]
MKKCSKVFVAGLLAWLLIMGISAPVAIAQQTVKGNYTTTEGLIKDDQLYLQLETSARNLVDQQLTTELATLTGQLNNSQAKVAQARKRRKKINEDGVYEACKNSVLVIGTLYKCSRCPNDHIRAASGFVISDEGVGVTSYHIFQGNATDERADIAHVAMDYQGNVYPIKEVLAASKTDDIAIFRFDAGEERLQALPLGTGASIGSDVQVIGHPHSMFYSFTKGTVSRLYWREGGEKMSVTADFAQGSSGGPVLNNKGEVVGVVSATLSLYNTDNNLQMVSKETIPVKAILSLLE